MPFSLLETMRLEDGRAVRLDRHLARMAASARFFGRPLDEDAVRAAVLAEAKARPEGCWRLRLLVDGDGVPRVECTPHVAGERHTWKVAFATAPVDGHDSWLRHKTTRRALYEQARLSRPDVDDVLLWNGNGEVTESTIANVVAEIDGVRCTPPLHCGLLPGVFRDALLADGAITERVLTKERIARAPRLWLVNSLREWIDAELV